tara:strand:+ start:210 stop:449 length:240 start_codon:yes stop_codon:yes gene_type:complete
VNKRGMTLHQREIYNFLKKFYKTYGIYPTIREIANGEIDGEQYIKRRKHHSATHETIKRLIEKGWVENNPGRWRALSIV